ncbi:MAG: 3-oxoacid CoA-transferase subunit B [Cyclobacteriaceae bacterium]|nr:3-oxoacid CoA-transferase subunit B [Cyclobacteriaceae bacterium]
MGDARQIIAKRAASEVKNGMIVNLGIGIPSLVPDYLDASIQVFFQAENGILGMGPTPLENADGNLSNAAGYPVTILPGGSYFDSAIAFGMIRRGCIDVSILGALQVSEQGDLANWIVPGKRVPGVGGAMELAYGAKNLIALMTHCEKDGRPKIVTSCTLPVTTYRCVKKIITEMAVFSISDQLLLEEIMPGYSLNDIRNHTEADFKISPDLKPNR